MDKVSIRALVKKRKALLSDFEKESAAARAFEFVEQLADFVSAENILLYHSLPDELSTHAFIERWYKRKHIYLPRVNGCLLDILPYDSSNLRQGAFNIEEPVGSNKVDISKIDLVIVPAVAYDYHGNRVGRGKGYYDRLLRNSDVIKVGVAYNCQVIELIEHDELDVPVDYVITDKGVICKP